MTRSELEALIRVHFESPRAEAILALARPSINIKPTRIAHELPVGTSCFGGLPDLPPGVGWPMIEDIPLLFAAQINLAELSGMANAGSLPASGMLSFFAERLECHGCGQMFGGGPAVLHHDVPSPRLRRLAPPPVPKRVTDQWAYDIVIPAHALAFRESIDLPWSPWSFRLEHLAFSAEDRDRYSDLTDAMRTSDGQGRIHKLLGHASAVQSDMEPELISTWGDPAQEASRADPSALQLLLQIDSLDTVGDLRGCWGGSGTLYFWVHRDDLAARRFKRVLFAMQGT